MYSTQSHLFVKITFFPWFLVKSLTYIIGRKFGTKCDKEIKLGNLDKVSIDLVKKIYDVVFDFSDYISVEAYWTLDPGRS